MGEREKSFSFIISTSHCGNTDVCMNHIEVLVEYKYMEKSLTQALTTLRMDISTFFVTQDRQKSTDSVQGTAAQESIDSVEGEESTISVG